MAKICDLTGKRTRSGHHVSHAHNKTKRKFYPNLQQKRLFLPELGLQLRLRVAAATLRTINQKGLAPVLRQAYRQGTLREDLKPLAAALARR